jgi:hypothetical protein
MAIPKSDKLAAESIVLSSSMDGPTAYMSATIPVVHGDHREIKQLYPLGEMIAIWQEANGTSIMLSDRDKYKNEGVVVGVGPNSTQVALGDVVLFPDKASPHIIDSDSGFYQNERIILISERNLLMKLRSIDYKLVN